MAFDRPTLTEIENRVISDFDTEMPDTRLKHNFVDATAEALSGQSHELHGHLEWNSRQSTPRADDDDKFLEWASVWGFSQLPATKGSGLYRFTGVDTSAVPALTQVKNADTNRIYEATIAGVIAGGVFDVDIIDTVAGVAGNLVAPATLTLVSPVAGIDPNGTLQNDINGGADEETVDELRVRFFAFLAETPQGGTDSDYANWVRETGGIKNVWVESNTPDLGAVTIFFTVVGGSQIPSALKIQEVHDYVDLQAPGIATNLVFAPAEEDLDFTITISPDNATTRANVTANLFDLIDTQSSPGGTIQIGDINTAVGTAAGVDNFTVSNPPGDVTSSAGAIFILGTITWV